MLEKILRVGSYAVAAVVTPVVCFATPVLDLSTAASGITAELGPAITAAMPIAGTIIAVKVGWAMFKRFTK